MIVKLMKQCFVVLCALIMPVPVVAAEEGAVDSVFSNFPDRRKDQFETSYGYAVFPYPYSLPGIGQGIGLVGGAMNIANTDVDVYGLMFGGDVKGIAGGVGGIHIIPERLILELGYSAISKVTLQSYSERGMNTDKDDYLLLEIDDSDYYGGRMTATFFERRFELYGAWWEGAWSLSSIRDKDGHVVVDAQEASREHSQTTMVGIRLDLTDDYADPRRGLRLDINRSSVPRSDSGPDFHIMDYNFTAYIPIGIRSTWAFNYLRSDVAMRGKGETDPNKIQALLGINCSDVSLTPLEQQYCTQTVNNTIAANTYGTATSLGGFSRLRSYSEGRFLGAHTQFVGTELRWNVTDEATPFDIWIMRDIRTAIQVAAFYELGSTADRQSEVGDTWRESYGVGVRMITASGAVFRGDFAFGDEGFYPDIFIGYPWEF